MTRIYTKEIEKCEDCPHCYEMWKGKGVCKKSKRSIPDLRELAEFCELEEGNGWRVK